MAAKPFGAVTHPLIFFMVKFLSFSFLAGSMFSSITCFALHLAVVVFAIFFQTKISFKRNLVPFKAKANALVSTKLVMGILASKLADAYCYLVGNLSAVSFYGNIGTCCKPSFSGNPNIMFMFCTAWPAAPFTRLSIAPIIIILPVLSSTLKLTSTKLLPSTHLVSGGVLFFEYSYKVFVFVVFVVYCFYFFICHWFL